MTSSRKSFVETILIRKEKKNGVDSDDNEPQKAESRTQNNDKRKRETKCTERSCN